MSTSENSRRPATKVSLYRLTDSAANSMTAEVDGLVLSRGGEPVALTEDQAQRLRDAGARLATTDNQEG